MYSKILIPLDGSMFAEAVLPYARLLAQELRIPVDLLYVNDTNEPPACAAYMANEYLTRVGASFGTTVGALVQSGHTAATIVEVAAAQREILIAMATHGYSGAKRWFLGSVAEKVVRTAPCPVLTLRHPEREFVKADTATTPVFA